MSRYGVSSSISSWRTEAVCTGDAMADEILIAREVIACVASKHQLIATFLPKPFLDSIGSGAHTHLGLQSSGGKRRKAHDKSIEDLRSQFLAGEHNMLHRY